MISKVFCLLWVLFWFLVLCDENPALVIWFLLGFPAWLPHLLIIWISPLNSLASDSSSFQKEIEIVTFDASGSLSVQVSPQGHYSKSLGPVGLKLLCTLCSHFFFSHLNTFGKFPCTSYLKVLALLSVAEFFFLWTTLVLPSKYLSTCKIQLCNIYIFFYFQDLNLTCFLISVWFPVFFIIAFKILIPFIHSLYLLKIYWAATLFQELCEVRKM